MMYDVIAAYQAYSKFTKQQDIEFEIETVNTGGDYKLLKQSAQKFLFQPQIKLILAFIDSYAASQIEPFINASGKVLISIDPGATIPGTHSPNPHQLSLSLQAAYGSALSTHLALQDAHNNVAYFTSFYDGGYLHGYSTARVLEKNGGAIKVNFISPFNASTVDSNIVKEKINESNASAIILQECAESGAVFLNSCSNGSLPTDFPIYASPFMLEENWISTHPYYFSNIQGFVPWHANIKSEENKLFVDFMFNETGKQANVFHISGWEAAMLVYGCASAINQQITHPIQVLDELSKTTLISPRGKLTWMPEQRHFVAPMHHVKLINNNGFYKTELMDRALTKTNTWLEFANDVPTGTISRWFNMYLCPT